MHRLARGAGLVRPRGCVIFLMTRPFCSVLIDTYNHERFIEQALVSVLE